MIFARWTIHLLTDEQKGFFFTIDHAMDKQIPKFNQRQFANVVTEDKAGVHYLADQLGK